MLRKARVCHCVRGFTLVEILIALSIFLILMALLATGVVQTSRSLRQGRTSAASSQQQRGCLHWMMKGLASILKPASPDEHTLIGTSGEVFFVYAQEGSLAETRYSCDNATGELRKYYESPPDYNPATCTEESGCLGDLSECAFSYSDGQEWYTEWNQTRTTLPRMVKLTYKTNSQKQIQEIVVTIPVSE